MKSNLFLLIVMTFCMTILSTFSCSSSAIASKESVISKDAPAANMAELLRRQAFVTVKGSGANIKLNIRGQRTMNTSNEPLLIVDGLRVGNSFDRIAHINPLDVARIHVVRDPGDLAGYGLGASNGVIEIYLKK